MDLKSIRWQLPLSYAGIALLSALVLGALMLLRLSSYYAGLERENLWRNARAIQLSLRAMDFNTLPSEVLDAQIRSFSFFTRSRVQLQDVEGNTLADSGERFWTFDVIRFSSIPAGMIGSTVSRDTTEVIVFEGPVDAGGASVTGMQVLGYPAPAEAGALPPGPSAEQMPWDGKSKDGSMGQVLISSSSGSYESPVNTMPVFSIFSLEDPTESREIAVGQVSKASVAVPALDREGNIIGNIILSGGPAYGLQILESVTQAWAIAGLLGVALAGAVGLMASRRISRPVLALTDVTGRMAGGDLSARALLKDLPAVEFAALGEAYNQMAARIEETVFTLRRFAVDAAHELKTPLTALQTNLELVTAESDPDRARLYVERAREQLRELENLMNGLLDLSRLESGSAWADQPIALNQLVGACSEVYAARAEQLGVNFEVNLPHEILWVQGDETRLKQALGNLLENALKFTPSGGTVHLGLEQRAEQAALWVEDSGIGIPAEDLPLLFSRFHRGHNAVAYPGSGLGLAIARMIFHAHSGAISASNGTKGGARFDVVLPVRSVP